MTTKIANYTLHENAVAALYELTLMIELEEGKRYTWRKNSDIIFTMVREAFNSKHLACVEKAINFFKLLPIEIQREFAKRKILPPTRERNSQRLYRGALIEDQTNSSKKRISKEIHSSTQDNGSAELTPESGNPQAKKRVKHVWRGVVTYKD